jgi:ferredoxin
MRRGAAMRVEVDFAVCESNGICMGVVPEVFDLGDDDQLTVREAHVPAARQPGVREAARQCPRQAISITD